MKYSFFVILFTLLIFAAFGQPKYFTKTGKISFYSKSSMENIEAVNTKVVSVWDVASGQIEFAVLLKGFEFEKALMQEHFNENYVESDKYPKAVFKGIIENSKTIQLSGDNVSTVKVNGTLTLHGVTNPVSTNAVITVKSGVVAASCNFSITLADYKISIPSLVAEKINKKISIAVVIPEYQSMTTK
ncbi:MAG: YceI family protein [Ferruginibacter sp.]|uniref:YceI family protein n=1 Tax=Ferruginibacter sp. TaxID=1940288 RepID=UPI00265A46DF|nr:YceI family protein [Ferruginibacter sp.]MDB5280157.1 YceI family protein [Ferruginibacter sp.]